MEDERRLVVDDEGHLDGRYRGWIHMNPVIWDFTDHLKHLDISFNNIKTLPDNIGKLWRLLHFDCSSNKIEYVPQSIGKLRKLKVFKANGNQLKSIPKALCDCVNLNVVNLSENQIETMPDQIEKCRNLTELYLQNNNLKKMPHVLAKLKETISTIDLSNNPKLEMIPHQLHSNTQVIMWILDLHNNRLSEVNLMQKAIREMEELLEDNNSKLVMAKDTMSKLKREKQELHQKRESIVVYLSTRNVVRRSVSKYKTILSQSKELFSRRFSTTLSK